MDNSLKRPPKRTHRHFIEQILAENATHPPSKRPRRFFIEELLAEENHPTEQQGSGSRQKSAKDFVRTLSSDVQHNRKFRCVHSKSVFSIQDVPADPEGFIAGIFQHCIDQATAESKERGIKPDHLGCTISSPLLASDIWHPIRPITADTVPSLLERFNEIAQSKAQDGISLWGEPFTVAVTVLERDALPTERQLSGGGRQKVLAPVHHRIHKQCLIKIKNPDAHNYCLFYAMIATLIRMIGGLNKDQFYNYLHGIRGKKGRLQREAIQLMETIGAPPNQNEYSAEKWTPLIIDHWNIVHLGKRRFKVFIFGATGHYKPLFKYGPDDYETPIILYYDGNAKHFDGVQKSGNLFGQPYCLSCEATYDRPSTHTMKCKTRCIKCSRVGPTFPCKQTSGYRKKCQDCKKTFFNDNCYQHHIRSNFCGNSKECDQCGLVYDVKDNTRNGRQGHKCFERYCQNCESFHDPMRGCFINPIEPPKTQEQKKWRLVAFDLETMQHAPADANDPTNGRRNHEPNFIAAKVACPECIENGEWKNSLHGSYSCAVCGPNRTITFSHQPFRKTKVDKQVITRHPLLNFIRWILYGLPVKYNTVAYSHYGGRFDMVLAFRELFMDGFNPSMIRKGNRLYTMRVMKQKHNGKVEFRDSWNLIPTSLAGMIPMFGLDVQDKPFFPHLANRPDNYECLIFPSKEDYLAGGMMPQKRKLFDQWYRQHGNESFLLDEALASYCTNDVEILMAGLVAFRSEFREITKRPAGQDGKADRATFQTPHEGIDPVRDCITIASACMRHFRTNHLKAGHLALVPEKGYDSCGGNQSELAFKFMDWYAWKHGVQIQNECSEEGEKKVGRYQLDGWIGSEQKGLEIHGCVFHGCPKCYPEDKFMFHHGKTAGLLRERNKLRMDYILTQVPSVEIYWECEIYEMLRKDKEMRQKFEQYDAEASGPLDIRSCFMGGRTGASKLFHAVGEDEEISYYDFTSLYPFINYATHYPVAHPKLDVVYEDVDWRKPEDNPYQLAILKVRVVPPRKIDVPVLPVRVKQRLCFPTCMACCKEFPEGAVMENYSCEHTDRERGWISTCTSLELEAALEEGYRVTELHRVLDYRKSDNSLFRPYIREFYKEKLQSSGFDTSIRGNAEAEQQFIRECVEMFEILIERGKMLSNKGRRALAKLCLNNLWGRFSLRNHGVAQTLITDDPTVLGEYLDNRKIEISSVDELTPETVLISYITKEEFIEEHPCSNVVISLFTTSAARLHLLRAMQIVARTPGCILLYTDTDSLIFVHPKGKNPLHLGPHLGQFTDEFPDHHIVEFCSGGSKQYGLKLQKKGKKNESSSTDFDYMLKVRGLTISHDVAEQQGLRYEVFKERVLQFAHTGEVDPIPITYPNFLRPSLKTGTVVSAPLKKIYRPYVGNGVVCKNTLNVLPFGHIPTQ